MNEDLETIIREVYNCYDARYGNAIVDLKQRIDKAIEYIKSKEEEEHINDYDEHYMDDYLDDYDEHLLDILKGKNE